ncbi:hypothetical protein C4J96_3341 [Pseudomonas orientalis]|nr:hypothetical protein C4J96_3341 [Pseudomonas orientalis]
MGRPAPYPNCPWAANKAQALSRSIRRQSSRFKRCTSSTTASTPRLSSIRVAASTPPAERNSPSRTADTGATEAADCWRTRSLQPDRHAGADRR